MILYHAGIKTDIFTRYYSKINIYTDVNIKSNFFNKMESIYKFTNCLIFRSFANGDYGYYNDDNDDTILACENSKDVKEVICELGKLFPSIKLTFSKKSLFTDISKFEVDGKNIIIVQGLYPLKYENLYITHEIYERIKNNISYSNFLLATEKKHCSVELKELINCIRKKLMNSIIELTEYY